MFFKKNYPFETSNKRMARCDLIEFYNKNKEKTTFYITVRLIKIGEGEDEILCDDYTMKFNSRNKIKKALQLMLIKLTPIRYDKLSHIPDSQLAIQVEAKCK